MALKFFNLEKDGTEALEASRGCSLSLLRVRSNSPRSESFRKQGACLKGFHPFLQAAKEEEERKKRERLAKEALAKIREVRACWLAVLFALVGNSLGTLVHILSSLQYTVLIAGPYICL